MTEIAKTVEPGQIQIQRAADPMVSLIERVVMDPNASVDKLERMLEMRERMQAQAAKQAFDNAIAEAKAEIRPIMKTGSVSYGEGAKKTEFRHETLDGIAKEVDPILSRHGLSYRFRSKQEGGQLHVTCVVAHRDGYAEEATRSGAPDTSGSKNGYQAVGSAATYLQRYTLKLALGLSAAKDDDAASVKQRDPISEDQYHALRALIEQAGGDEEALLKFLKVDDLTEIPAGKYGVADKILRQKIAAKKGATA